MIYFAAAHLANTNVPTRNGCGWYDWYYCRRGLG